MAHYAFLDASNIVTEVIVGRNEDEVVENISDWETYYGSLRNQVCKRTSYNTHGGTHRNGGVPFRKNFAGIGYTYDEVRDAFLPPKPNCHPEDLILNANTCLWECSNSEHPSPIN